VERRNKPSSLRFGMIKNLPDHRWVFNTNDDPAGHWRSAWTADDNIDVKQPFQAPDSLEGIYTCREMQEFEVPAG